MLTAVGGAIVEPDDGPPDDAGDAIVGASVELVQAWLTEATRTGTRAERRDAARLRALTADPASVDFTMAFADRVLRPESAAVSAEQLRQLAHGALPQFLTWADRRLLRAGAAVSRRLPGLVMPLARRHLRRMVRNLVVDSADRAIATHLRHLESAGFGVNVNLLGESVLGRGEADRRLEATIKLLQRDDVRYVSIKASSITAQLNLWGYDQAVDRVADSMRRLLRAAATTVPPTFVNVDMEEYRDLRLTIDALTRVLDEPELLGFEAGVVLQAYLPDSFDALRELTGWARSRRERGGAGLRVRVVKGANLAMERVDAAVHGWVQAPYATKAETDANAKRMLDWAFRRECVDSCRIGVASHNLFDVAWAMLLADARGVSDRVGFEMLHGMAPGMARTVRAAAGGLLLYTPVVAKRDFDAALAYLSRRLEENSSGENFLRHLFDLTGDSLAFAAERARFQEAVAARWDVSRASRRQAAPRVQTSERFINEPDLDPTDPAARHAITRALTDPSDMRSVPEITDVAGVDAIVAAAVEGARDWQKVSGEQRATVLRAVAEELVGRRPELVALMAREAGKTVVEGVAEVSEAIDFARYYADRIDALSGGDGAVFEPLGVVAVIPPWNFPLAIPAGGVLAALAAGNAVIIKTAPQTPCCAYAVAEACWAAGVPQAALHFLRCPDDVVGTRLVTHPDIGGIILTGSLETAELFTTLAPTRSLFAETSGKNAMVVMPDADIDLAVADLVRSAFGHAGQKCSAASLAICVGSVATSDRFRRQLVDAARSLDTGTARRPEAVMGPLIGAPSPPLLRALTTLEDGQRWLLEPCLIDDATNLWSPGILDGVRSGSWFHRTECFGPVLGLMAASNLEEALALQNAVAFGLTGGIHTLDPATADRWLDAVEVGNAYINRGTTGAIVQRQPFGGWKRSVVGPGAKAGGPNYVTQFGRWRNVSTPVRGADPSASVARLVAAFHSALTTDERTSLDAAARSDAHWWRVEFGSEHDPTGLFCEANVFRYRPLREVVIRIAADAGSWDIARVLAAATVTGAPLRLSVANDFGELPAGLEQHRESDDAFAAWAERAQPDRVRLVGRHHAPRASLPGTTFADDHPVIADGRVEMLRYLREQAISRTLHRFGNIQHRQAG